MLPPRSAAGSWPRHHHERFKIQFTAGRELRDKLLEAQALMRDRIPGGELAAVFDAALRVLLRDLRRKKFARTETRRPRHAPGHRGRVSKDRAPGDPAAKDHGATDRGEAARKRAGRTSGRAGKGSRSRHIPNAVKREVYERDGGRCTFVGDNGHRCTERAHLELHHVRPFASGGASTAQNVILRCKSHNAYQAELDYGAAYIARRRRLSAELPPAPVAPAGRAGHGSPVPPPEPGSR